MGVAVAEQRSNEPSKLVGGIGWIAAPACERPGDYAAGIGIHGDDVGTHDAGDRCAGVWRCVDGEREKTCGDDAAAKRADVERVVRVGILGANAGAIVVCKRSIWDREDGTVAEKLSRRQCEGQHHRANHGGMVEAEPVS